MSEFKYKDKNGQVMMILGDRLFVRWDSRWVPASESIEILPVSIELSDSTLALAEQGTDTLTATISPDTTTNKDLIWSSSDEAVATVSEEGLVTGVAAGSAVITCKCASDPTVKATCEVTVS